MRVPKAFTLIELLIVVAIIAILAAIAVPNFLEAQTRSKVSRTLADMRTMRTGLESYMVDNNHYPETDWGLNALVTTNRASIFRLTTPIAYLTSIPSSPWKEKYGTATPGDPKLASVIPSYLYIRQELASGETAFAGLPDVNRDYGDDRFAYVIAGRLMATQARLGIINSGSWELKSVGPDNLDDRDSPANDGFGLNARVYDPTNGTVSRGDIVCFGDTPTTGKAQ
jgi:type II secretion system protein G